MRIEIIRADTAYGLETSVNMWLKENEADYSVKNIQYVAYAIGYGSQHNAMISYERRV